MTNFANGKICYIEIPTDDVETSKSFYQECFGWHSRTRGDGSVAFDDTVGEVSGTWKVGRKAASDASMIIYIMVMNIEETIAKIEANGGTITQPVGADAPEITARFRDPYGNVFGLYQSRG